MRTLFPGTQVAARGPLGGRVLPGRRRLYRLRGLDGALRGTELYLMSLRGGGPHRLRAAARPGGAAARCTRSAAPRWGPEQLQAISHGNVIAFFGIQL